MSSKITFGNRVKIDNSVKGFINQRVGEERRQAFNSAVTAFKSLETDSFVRMSTPKRNKGVLTLEVASNGLKAKYNLPKHFFILSSPKAINEQIKSYFNM